MAILQFIPLDRITLHFSAHYTECSYFKQSVKLDSERDCIIKETGKKISGLKGRIIFHTDDSDIARSLKAENQIGIISYHEGVEEDYFSIEIHLTNMEFERLLNIASNKNTISIFSIETPFKNELLKYPVMPNGPIEWSIKSQNWVPIEKCDFNVVFE